MIRKSLAEKNIGKKNDFRWRGHEITRVEGFSDAVFAFAITLLVVSLEVPKSFSELINIMLGFFPFAICFAFIILIWYQQYLFFRRYGIQDKYVIILNSILLFVVLYYIYPLKFLFSMLSYLVFGINVGKANMLITITETPTLMLIYSSGYLAIFFIFVLLYKHALNKKDQLELTGEEELITLFSMQGSMVHVFIALLSIVIVIAGGSGLAAGLVYILIGPAYSLLGIYQKKRRDKMLS